MSIHVTQHPKHVAINRGENVKFSCALSFTTSLRIYWWKQGESEYLAGDHKKVFGLENTGSAFFKLLDAALQDSGIYYCTVVTQGNITVDGAGSHLTVCVPPIVLKLSSNAPQKDSSPFLTLLCETTAFYPENVTFTWSKNSTEITTGIITTNQLNAEGLFEASSCMEETQSVQNGTVYTCRVFHLSLQTPGIGNYTVHLPNIEEKDRLLYLSLIAGCTVGLFFLVLLVFFGNRSKFMKMKGVHRKQNDPDHHNQQAMQGGDAETVTYITLDLKSSNKLSRPKHQEDRTVYAKIKQKAEDDKQVYATLEFSGPETVGKPKKSNPNIEYTTVQTMQGAAGNNLTYATLHFSDSKTTQKIFTVK
eukprot:gi/632972918/ref/XP_007902894.1/ PREDICTED: uncharacterized protein LOC103185939 [Callorhinchus milii]